LRPNEHLLDYISRVKDLRTTILDHERREKRFLDPHFVTEIDSLTTRSFIDGLPFEYRIQMGPETRQQYTDAFAAAKVIAKRKELDKQRETDKQRDSHYKIDHDRDFRQNLPTNKPPTHSTSYRPNLSESRHSTPQPNSPRKENPPPVRDARTENWRNSQRETRPVEVICRYCKTPGHELFECRKRQYNNARKEESGNARGPSGNQGATSADEKRNTRPVKPIEIVTNASNSESQS
ncbi:hypothetical protein ALC62_12490, partial [Cyphomyrmex costatus]